MQIVFRLFIRRKYITRVYVKKRRINCCWFVGNCIHPTVIIFKRANTWSN